MWVAAYFAGCYWVILRYLIQTPWGDTFAETFLIAAAGCWEIFGDTPAWISDSLLYRFVFFQNRLGVIVVPHVINLMKGFGFERGRVTMGLALMSPMGDCRSIWLLIAERHGYWLSEMMTLAKSQSIIWLAGLGSVVVNRIRVCQGPFWVELRKFVTHDDLGFYNQIFVNFFICVAKDLLVHDFLIFFSHFCSETFVDSELSQWFQVVIYKPAIRLERELQCNGLINTFPRGTIGKISILTHAVCIFFIGPWVSEAPDLGLLLIQPRAPIS